MTQHNPLQHKRAKVLAQRRLVLSRFVALTSVLFFVAALYLIVR